MAVARFRARAGRGTRGRIPVAGIHPGYEAAVQQQVNALLEEFKAWTAHMTDQQIHILEAAVKPTLEKARDIYAPVDTGKLKKSAYLETRKFRGRSVVEIGFGKGGRPAYAALVHERLDFYHEPPTRAKFLQAAIEEDLDKIRQTLLRGEKEASGT